MNVFTNFVVVIARSVATRQSDERFPRLVFDLARNDRGAKLVVFQKIALFIFTTIAFFLFALPAHAQTNEETAEAAVTKILEERESVLNGNSQTTQKLELKGTSGSIKNQNIIVESGSMPTVNARMFKTGDKVLVTITRDIEGNVLYYISDYVRRDALFLLAGVFVALVVFIGRRRGIASIVGMGLSFLIIFWFVLPQVLAGRNPILVAVMAAVVIIPLTFFLSHGINKKTSFAIAGTLISLIITGILATVFVQVGQLTGFASEEAAFLQIAKPDIVNIKNVLLAGILIGILGILDDVTISQASIIYQLKKTSPNLTFGQLYSKAMDVGRDHIASLVNTLILVYTGAAMPLLLLFLNNPRPFTEVINYEIIAEEIVRTLVASIGLILAVPITSFITAYAIRKPGGF